MKVSYKPLWDTLKSKKMKKKHLMEQANITANCLANMSKGEFISLRNLAKICLALKCTPNDVMFFQNEETK